MHRSSTNTSSTSASHGHGYHGHAHNHPNGATCSCGNPIHSGSSSSKPYPDLGLSSPSKPLTTAAALKRQRELREFALVSLHMFCKLVRCALTALHAFPVTSCMSSITFTQIDKLLSRIFWLRFYEDAARLYSTRLTLIAKERLPYLMQNIIGALYPVPVHAIVASTITCRLDTFD